MENTYVAISEDLHKKEFHKKLRSLQSWKY